MPLLLLALARMLRYLLHARMPRFLPRTRVSRARLLVARSHVSCRASCCMRARISCHTSCRARRGASLPMATCRRTRHPQRDTPRNPPALGGSVHRVAKKLLADDAAEPTLNRVIFVVLVLECKLCFSDNHRSGPASGHRNIGYGQMVSHEEVKKNVLRLRKFFRSPDLCSAPNRRAAPARTAREAQPSLAL